MFKSYLGSIAHNQRVATIFILLPILLYIIIFSSISLNINYVAFDDILILGIIPQVQQSTSWMQTWEALSSPFPEHRLIFSRSVVLFFNTIFGHLNLVWLMIVGNICWALCAFVFYKAFQSLKINLWYFVPITWLWFNIQFNENIFWGVSSLCNFGVLLFVLCSLYFTVFKPENFYLSIIFAVLATYTYGNGMLIFPIIIGLYLIRRAYINLVVTSLIFLLIAFIYFAEFKPITQNLNFLDTSQVKAGFFGFWGFLGSIATLKAIGITKMAMLIASVTGMVLFSTFLVLAWSRIISSLRSIFNKGIPQNRVFLFSLGIFLFVVITSLALTYKRIPTDGYEGMFKGRYRMYGTLMLISLYFVFLQMDLKVKSQILKYLIPVTIGLNLVILHSNFALAVEGRRTAIVQEFNARYNQDWLGLKMFSMDQRHFEDIRSIYKSDDPLAENNPLIFQEKIISTISKSPFKIDTLGLRKKELIVSFDLNDFSVQKDFSDGVYTILKSDNHIYASSPHQNEVPIKTTIRRAIYFSRRANAVFHFATIEPGKYRILFLARQNGVNTLYETGHHILRKPNGSVSIVN